MVEDYFKHFATNFRIFPKVFENIQRLPMISEDFVKNLKMLEGRLEHFATFSDFFRKFPKISEDFQNFRKLVGMFVFALSGAFS